MAFFIDLSQATQDSHRFTDGRFMQLHRLETPCQRRVFLEVFLVLRPGGGRDGAQLATGQRGLEQVGGIGTARVGACTDQRVRLVDKQNDGLGRRLDLIDHAFKTTLELAFDAGPGLQQPHVQGQQLDPFQHLRHFTSDDAQCQAFDDCGFTHTGFADHNGIVLTASGEDIDHLPNGVIATQYGVKFAVTCLLGQVVGEALKQRFPRCDGFGGSAFFLLGQGEFLQPVDIQLGQQRLVATAGVAHRVTQQCENQRGLFDLGLAQLKVGHQQTILQPLHQFRGKHRVARGAVLDPRLQGGAQFARIYVGILQGARKQALRTLKQTEQQVFHEDLAAAAANTTLCRALQVPTGFGVQRLYQLLQIYVAHTLTSLMSFAAQGDDPVCAFVAEPTGPSQPTGVLFADAQLTNFFVAQHQPYVVIKRVA